MKLFTKIKEKAFILKAVPPLRLMYTSSIALIVMIFIEFFMLLLSTLVHHNSNGFSYFFKGIYFLLVKSRKEPNSEQGFIFAAVILGYLPSIITVFIIYFAFISFIKNYKLKTTRFYNESDSDKINFLFNMGHIFLLAASLTLIPLIFVLIFGGSAQPWKTVTYIGYFASEEMKERVLGAFSFVYLFMGLPLSTIFLLIVIVWLIYKAIVYIFIGIKYAISTIIDIVFRRTPSKSSKEVFEEHDEG